MATTALTISTPDILDYLVDLRMITHNSRLVKARQDKGLKQRDLAKMFGKCPAFIGHIENLRTVPSFEVMERLADILDRPVDYLFPGYLMMMVREGVFHERRRTLDEPDLVQLREAHQLASEAEDLMIDDMDREMLRDRLMNIIDEISRRYSKSRPSFSKNIAKILDLRFGLTTGEPLTVVKIAEEIGVSSARVLQLEALALRMMRHPDYSQGLRPFLHLLG